MDTVRKNATLTRLGCAFAGLALVGTIGCADGTRPKHAAPKSTQVEELGEQRYSIKFFVTEDGKTRQFNAAPSTSEGRLVEAQVPTSKSQQQTPSGGSGENVAQSSEALEFTVCEDADGGDCITAEETTAATDALLKYALLTCEGIYDYGFRSDAPPWSENYWYIFATLGGQEGWPACDLVLAGQEALLCVADRLAEVADAVDTTVWRPKEPGTEVADVTVRIPPQASKDRFIVRDLALNVLAHLARLEYTAPGQPYTVAWERAPSVCFDAFRKMADGTVSNDVSSVSTLFGYGYDIREALDGPGNGDPGDVPPTVMGLNRLNFKSELLLSAARLTRDLLDKSVSADLAGAEWQRAHAADPVAGIQAMWGQDPQNPEAYNSLEHALKMLFGRLEIERKSGAVTEGIEDLKCNGVESWDLVDALGPGFSARWNDRPPATPGQSLAISAVAKSGVVVPGVQLTSANASNLRAAIEEMLLKQAALSQDADKDLTTGEFTAFQNTLAAKAIRESMVEESISDGDLLVGLERAFDVYRLLTDSAASITSITAKSGLTLVPSGEVHANITSLGGAVIKGGLPRDDLSTDVMARLGGAQVASQCSQDSVSLKDQGTQWQQQLQSPFLLANVFGKRLADISQAVAPLSLTGADALESKAATGAAEVRSWAGEATIVHGWGDFVPTPTSSLCPSSSLKGTDGFCSAECPCGEGVGACSSDNECTSGLVCLKNKGDWWGLRKEYGICVSKTSCNDWIQASTSNNPAHASFCANCKCVAGKGDCNSAAECAPGLACVNDVGNKFGYSNNQVDVCLPNMPAYPHASCPTSRTAGPSETYCSSTCPCFSGQGDADSGQCYGNLGLVNDIGPEYGMPADYDLCEPQHQTDTQTFVLSGIQPKDLGVTTNAQLLSKLTLVFGKSWMAECVAGLRKSCPEDMSGATAIAGFNRFDLSATNTTTLTTGSQGHPAPTFITKFDFIPDIDPNNAGNLWYVIAHGDPAAGRHEGRVLATLAKGTRGTSRMEIVSKYREELANEVFGLGGAPRSTETCSGTGSTSMPGNYCIEGMKRDMFVPLANELTGNSETREDSWQHYLALAEEAAAEADDLGRQMIEAGKERERKKLEDHIFVYNRDVTLRLRKEAAQEQLAELCGAFIDETAITVENGEFVVDGSEPEIRACLSLDPIDLVFLGADPFKNVPAESAVCELRGCEEGSGAVLSDSEVQEQLRELFCKEKTPEDSAKDKSLPSFCANNPIRTRGLNLTAAPPQLSTDTCGEIVQLAQESITAGSKMHGATLAKTASEPWASANGLLASLSRLQYGHAADGGWGLTLYGRPIMGNKKWLDQWFATVDDKTVFPACREVGECACAPGKKYGCTVTALDAAFNRPGLDEEQIRLNLERALWHMGALAGHIPGGVFWLTMPVANLKNDGQTSFAPAIYSYGQFVADSLNPDNFLLKEILPDSPLAARWWLAPATVMDIDFAERLRDSSRKPWLTELYTQAASRLGSDASSYLTVLGVNSPISFNPEFWSFKSFENADGAHDALTRGTLAVWLQEFGRKIDGRQCSSVADVFKPVAALSSFSPTQSWPYLGCDNEDAFCGDAEPDDRVRVFAREVCGGAAATQQDAPRVLVETGPSAERLFLRGAGHGETRMSKDEQLPFLANESLVEGPWSTSSMPLNAETKLMFGPNQQYSDTAGYHWSDYSPGDESVDCHGEDHEIPQYCLKRWNHGFVVPEGDVGVYRFAGRQLRPDVCRVDQRVELFVDRTVDNSCDATKAITQALALSCLSAKAPTKGLVSPPPQVATLGQLQQLEVWLALARASMAGAVSAMHLQSVPAQAIEEFRSGTLSTAAIGKGNQGNLTIALQTSLLGISNAWTNLTLALAQIQDSVALTRAQLEKNQLNYEARLLDIDLQRIELNRKDALRAIVGAKREFEKMKGAFEAVIGVGSNIAAQQYLGAFMEVANAAQEHLGPNPEVDASEADALYDSQVRSLLGRIAANAADSKAVDDLITLLSLSKDAKAEFKNVNDSLYQLKLHSLTAIGTLNLMEMNREKAKWQLAKIKGEGFVEFGGEVTSQEINNVLARQYDGLRIRYERALERAKRAAYLARLAIEQRLGVRFAGMSEPVGPLRQAPAIWADDICTLQGVDYNALKTSFGPEKENGSSADPMVDEITTQFADAFIGDYVSQLRELVEFYLIEHPFQEADDVAVLSLKENLLNGNIACTRNSINELFHSHALHRGGSVLEDFSSLEGWRVNRCAGVDCVDVQSEAALNAARAEAEETTGLQPPNGMGGISWLKPYTATIAPPPIEGDPSVERTVYQSVNLAGGEEYVLSWWDMARAIDGTDPGSNLAEYSASIYDSEWNLVGGEALAAADPGSEGLTWSDRREVTFFTAAEGVYHVAFRLESTTASVAIGNVQLERAAGPGAGASYYSSVEEKRLERNPDCDRVEDLSRFFNYRCENNGVVDSCFWELNKLIRLDTEALNQGVGPLVGKVGVGNYNHRLLSTMVNVVGSGVLDCSKDPRDSCYGSAYLEYDMDHASFNVPIDDYDGQVRCFDFGSGTIRGAKALASERYLTMPLSSADQELISQPSFTKPEFSGRPLSGQYRLRIKDHPALSWANVDDIQLVMGYRYWSRVGTAKN